MSRKGIEITPTTSDVHSNLSLSLRSGVIHARNETDRDLRVNVVPNWPNRARAQSTGRSSVVGCFRSLSPIGDRSKSFWTSLSSPEGELGEAQNNNKQLEATAPAAEETTSDKINKQRQQMTELLVVVDSKKTDKSSELSEHCSGGFKIDSDESETVSSHRKFLQQYTTASSSHSKSMERPGYLKIVSDSIIAFKPFTGMADEDAEAWLDYLRRYAEHRHLQVGDFLTLFKLMMREAAADWLATVNRSEDRYDTPDRELKRLIKLFENNYYRLAEFKWKETGDLWGKPQKATESVQDYMNCVF